MSIRQFPRSDWHRRIAADPSTRVPDILEPGISEIPGAASISMYRAPPLRISRVNEFGVNLAVTMSPKVVIDAILLAE